MQQHARGRWWYEEQIQQDAGHAVYVAEGPDGNDATDVSQGAV
jgi:hypothetical protein